MKNFLIFILLLVVLGGLFFCFYASWAQTSGVTATVRITVCGNDFKEAEEECDGIDLGGQDCVGLDYDGGTLSCKADCTFNTSGCTTTPPPPPPSGGSGSGGSIPPPPPETAVKFSGKAYPNTTVTLLKDAQVVVSTVAGADANFQTKISGLSPGNYIFSLYSEDREGRRSSLLTFPISVSKGATTNVSGVFIAPTIDIDKTEVKRGDNLAIFGQSAPKSDVIIWVSSEEEFFVKTVSDNKGAYLYNFDTSPLGYGVHYTKSKASVSNLISSFSYVVNFKVGTKTVIKPLVETVEGDVNNDNRVNLIDFSIAAYWYKRPSPPVKVDLNNDSKVDLIDFSIMAYYWTG